MSDEDYLKKYRGSKAPTVYSYDKQKAVEAYKTKLEKIRTQLKEMRKRVFWCMLEMTNPGDSNENKYLDSDLLWSAYDSLVLELYKHKKTDPNILTQLGYYTTHMDEQRQKQNKARVEDKKMKCLNLHE